MNIFIDEYGKIFCEFKKGIYSPISDEYFNLLKLKGLVKNVEVCVGEEK